MFTFSWSRQWYIFIDLPRYYVNSPALSDIFQRDMDHLHIPQTIRLVHYIHDIMFSRRDKQEIANILKTLIRFMFYRERKVNPRKILNQYILECPVIQDI